MTSSDYSSADSLPAESPRPDFDELTGGFSREFGVEEITAEELIELLNQRGKFTGAWMLVDVRTREEQSVSTIPGANLIRPQDGLFKNDLHWDFRDRCGDDALCVVFCTGGKRSAMAAAEVRERFPRDRIVNVRGGLIAYANLGGRLVKRDSGEPTDELHGYNEKWAAYIEPPTRAVLKPPVPKSAPEATAKARENESKGQSKDE